MADSGKDAAILPGQGLGYMSTSLTRVLDKLLTIVGLGSSLQSILSMIQKNHGTFPAIDLHFSQNSPLATPIVVNLPKNGVRLRFDAVEQQLRLIEVLDFSRMKMTYKGTELLKHREDGVKSGPAFRRIYQIFGASFPGEYNKPNTGSTGTYILSWTGIAFSFPLLDSAWSSSKDHVSLLSSQAASNATSMAIFDAKNWTEARMTLYTKQPSGPRLSQQAAYPKDAFPVEIASVRIRDGKVELLRALPTTTASICLNETSPEDLITDLGPPDTTHRRDIRVGEEPVHKRAGSVSKTTTNGRPHTTSQPSSYSSTATDTYEIEFDSKDEDDDPVERANRDVFWCYFDHGMDILVGAPNFSESKQPNLNRSLVNSSDTVVTKVILHGNVPGSYAFNRHRRIRWTIESVGDNVITSEMNFETTIKPQLLRKFAGVLPESEMARGKVVNRTWSAGPNDSSFFLPDAGEDLVEGVGSEQWLGNTRLYHFPGLAFEVMENGTVIALSVSL